MLRHAPVGAARAVGACRGRGARTCHMQVRGGQKTRGVLRPSRRRAAGRGPCGLLPAVCGCQWRPVTVRGRRRFRVRRSEELNGSVGCTHNAGDTRGARKQRMAGQTEGKQINQEGPGAAPSRRGRGVSVQGCQSVQGERVPRQQRPCDARRGAPPLCQPPRTLDAHEMGARRAAPARARAAHGRRGVREPRATFLAPPPPRPRGGSRCGRPPGHMRFLRDPAASSAPRECTRTRAH